MFDQVLECTGIDMVNVTSTRCSVEQGNTLQVRSDGGGRNGDWLLGDRTQTTQGGRLSRNELLYSLYLMTVVVMH